MIPLEVAKLCLEALLLVEWHQNGGGTWTCPGCGGWEFQRVHRNDECRINRALNALGYTTRERRDEELGRVKAQISKERYG